jgi:gamma-glutamyl-gamma-aminobutyrate hydrolase PuuD
MENNKEKLKIAFANGITESEYVRYLNIRYDVEIIDVVNNSSNFSNLPHLIVFTGGPDVSPSHYDQEKGKFTFIDSSRDKIEINTFHRFNGLVKMLGICRGAQLLTVLNGGSLIQHVEGHTSTTHTITSKYGSSFSMRGDHHQMMYPFNINDNLYEIIYHSQYFQSSTYLNGNNEEIELPTNFVEPEIVYYNTTKSLCIQGHPEWMQPEHPTVEITLDLIKSRLFNNLPISDTTLTSEYFYDDENDENDDENDDEGF